MECLSVSAGISARLASAERMSGLGAKDAPSSDKDAGEVSEADADTFTVRDLPQFFDLLDSSASPNVRTKLNDAEYHIGSGKRGKCVIFNYETFKKLPQRRGTEEDVKQLSDRFSELGFDIIVHNDLPFVKTWEELQRLGQQDYTQDDCFVCWILTHGENGYLYTVDGKLMEDQFISPFRENKSLLGKPKLFFIQSCRGECVDMGEPITFDGADSCGVTCRILAYADILVAYATVPDFKSWRNTMSGSWFVQAFCYVLGKRDRSEDLLALLTETCRLVAIFYQADTEEVSTRGAKMTPYVTSTLTRHVRFPKMPRM